MRVSSPPTTNPCFYGVDTPTREELIASANSPEQICHHLGADSLAYLSHAGMLQAAAEAGSGFCTACFDGHYPVPPEAKRRVQLELFQP